MTQRKSAYRLACPPLHFVRIGLVGLGRRGMKTLSRYAAIKDAAICRVADVLPERAEEAQRVLAATGRPLAAVSTGTEAWREVCAAEDTDVVYICTDWASHCRIAVEAMRHGKHAVVEVPAATSVDECRLLVRTAEETQRHCFMTENCCYDIFHLETLEMARRGLLGTLTHLEGGYIHRLDEEKDTWMAKACATHGGNPYPTHGLGPMAQLLGLHRSDRMETLVSLTSRPQAEDGADGAARCSNTLIRTRRGATILLQLDVTTPRPYSRLQTVCGTRGFVQKYPVPCVQTLDTPAATGEEAMRQMSAYACGAAADAWREGNERGQQNAMNYAMDARLIHCLKNGLPLDIDVYDAAEWSCVAELSRISAEAGGKPVAVPYFLPE